MELIPGSAHRLEERFRSTDAIGDAKLLQFQSKAAWNPKVLHHGRVPPLRRIGFGPYLPCSLRQIDCKMRQT
jgi:hypothetical protein